MKLFKYAVAALLVPFIMAVVPKKCLVPTGVKVGKEKGESEDISDVVSSVATSSTHFFGIRVCTDIVTDRMVTIQFYLKDDESDEF